MPVVQPGKSRMLCTQSRQRTLTVRRRQAYVALEAARQRERTKAFAESYAEPSRYRRYSRESECDAWDCAGRATLESHVHTFNTWQLPLLSICLDYMTG
jgi:hypothetical protein